MIEIILVVYLCFRMAALMRKKGRSPVGYCFMLVGFWILGEVVFGVGAAFMMADRSNTINPMAYLFAIVGAGVGAVLAFVIANSQTSLLPRQNVTGGFPVVQPPYQPPQFQQPPYQGPYQPPQNPR